MSKSRAPVQPQRLKNLLRRLIDIYSPSGKEEELLDYLHGYLKRHGLPFEVQDVDDNRYNLVIHPPEGEIRLILIGHVDTVMAYDLDQYGYEEEGDLVYGLGAADMKGGCAAMIEAYLSIWEQGGTRPPVALALVVGEEEEGDGARRLVKDFHPSRALIGEPTGLQPCLGSYSYIEVQVTTRGKRVHASLANQSQNPIDMMLRLLLKITHYLETERPEIVYNVRELSSSRSGFAVPEHCEAWLDLHLPPMAPLGEITMELEDLVLKEREGNTTFNGTLRFATIHAGYQLPEKGPLVEALKTVFDRHTLPWKPEAFRSHSDANLLWAAGVKPILLGPGHLEEAHTRDESVSFKEVLLAAQLYFDLMNSFK